MHDILFYLQKYLARKKSKHKAQNYKKKKKN